MFGKLLKHEIIDTWKIFLLLDVVALLLGVIVGAVGFVAVQIKDMPSILIILLVLGVVGYLMLLVSLSVLTLVHIVVHFYRSMFSSQGYLTFTLPATATQIVSAKLLSAVIFQLINSVCVTLSICLAVWGVMIAGYKEAIDEVLDFLYDFKDLIIEAFGIAPGTIVLYIVFGIVSLFSGILIFYCSMCIGQLWQKHKVLGSVVAYFAITIVTRIVTTIVQLTSGSFGMLLSDYDLDPTKYFSHTMTVNLIISIIAAGLMYFGCIYTTSHKLNLD